MSDDKRSYECFLIDYYVDQLQLAHLICKQASIQNENILPVILAVFDKVARPAFYLDKDFQKWQMLNDEQLEASTPQGTMTVADLVSMPWKGKTISAEGEHPKRYASVMLGESQDYGWMYADELPETIIGQLRTDPIVVDGFQFKLSDDGRLVQANKRNGNGQ